MKRRDVIVLIRLFCLVCCFVLVTINLLNLEGRGDQNWFFLLVILPVGFIVSALAGEVFVRIFSKWLFEKKRGSGNDKGNGS